MPHDPHKVAELREWLDKCQHDLRAAQVLLETQPPLTDVAVFHCQQAAEKAFKALLFWRDEPFRKTHELELLGVACQKLDPSLAPLVERAVMLTPFVWRFRYPGEPSPPPLEEAQEALALAKEVFQAVLDRLPTEIPNG